MNQRGFALPITLVIMTALLALTMSLLSLSAFEPQIAKNLSDAAQAGSAADSGLEWAFNTLAGTSNWNTLLTGATASGVTMVSNSPIGTLSGARGTYTVILRNDTLASDTALTGVAPDASSTSDANSVVIVTATGAAGAATKSRRVVVKRLTFPSGLFPGALSFPGVEAEVSFSGTSFDIDGNGWKMNGSSLDTSCAAVYGIAVSATLPASNPGKNESVIQSSLTSTQKSHIKGKQQSTSSAGTGNNTIAPDATLTPTYLQSFINQAKAMADISLTSKAPSGLSYTSVGSTCATDPSSPTCWGTASAPKIVYVKGDLDPTAAFNALTVSGTSTGYGILIVEDGDLVINGGFTWYGPIIVSGSYTGVKFAGGGTQTVYGAVISNETATDAGFYEGTVTSTAKVRYSCEALTQALNTRKAVRMSSWKDLAPGE